MNMRDILAFFRKFSDTFLPSFRVDSSNTTSDFANWYKEIFELLPSQDKHTFLHGNFGDFFLLLMELLFFDFVIGYQWIKTLRSVTDVSSFYGALENGTTFFLGFALWNVLAPKNRWILKRLKYDRLFIIDKLPDILTQSFTVGLAWFVGGVVTGWIFGEIFFYAILYALIAVLVVLAIYIRVRIILWILKIIKTFAEKRRRKKEQKKRKEEDRRKWEETQQERWDREFNDLSLLDRKKRKEKEWQDELKRRHEEFLKEVELRRKREEEERREKERKRREEEQKRREDRERREREEKEQKRKEEEAEKERKRREREDAGKSIHQKQKERRDGIRDDYTQMDLEECCAFLGLSIRSARSGEAVKEAAKKMRKKYLPDKAKRDEQKRARFENISKGIGIAESEILDRLGRGR